MDQLDWSALDTDGVTIVMQPRGEDGLTFTESSVFDGLADFQPREGELFTDPSGQTQIIDAVLLIDPDADGNLPTIEITDGGPTYVARIAGTSYNVVFSAHWTAFPEHLKLTLKRGPQKYAAK
jgi:hypothetical protein